MVAIRSSRKWFSSHVSIYSTDLSEFGVKLYILKYFEIIHDTTILSTIFKGKKSGITVGKVEKKAKKKKTKIDNKIDTKMKRRRKKEGKKGEKRQQQKRSGGPKKVE